VADGCGLSLPPAVPGRSPGPSPSPLGGGGRGWGGSGHARTEPQLDRPCALAAPAQHARRTGLVVSASRSPAQRVEVRPPATDRSLLRRFHLPRAASDRRGRWRAACRYPADRARDAYLQSLGYRVVRVWNNDVIRNLDGILQMLTLELESAPHPVPLPASGEREPG